jgi:diguanylate cyclase (GGDEF)-like protein
MRLKDRAPIADSPSVMAFASEDRALESRGDERSPRRGVKASYGVLIFVLVAYMVSLVVRGQHGPAPTWLDGWGVAGFELLLSLLMVARGVMYKRDRRYALLLGLAGCSWAAGDFANTYLSLGGARVPTLALDNYLWAGFFPLAYVGVMVLMRRDVKKLTAANYLDGVVATLVTAAALVAFAFPWIVSASGGGSEFAAVNLVYPVGDLLLFGLTALGIVMLAAGRGRARWYLIALAGACNAVGDTSALFNGLLATDVGWFFNVVAWPASLLMISSAVWLAPDPGVPVRENTSSGFRIPAVASGLALAILFVCALEHLSQIAIGFATATLLAAGARFGLALQRLGELTEERHRELEIAAQAERESKRVALLEAHTDELTGLANRRQLYKVADRLLDEERPLAMLLVDLNRFKEINDTLGHNAGDELLRQVAARLAEAVPPSGLLARLGGDEFAALLPDASEEREVVRAAEVLLRVFDEPFPLDGLTIPVQASIGVGVAPLHANTRPEVLRCADVAMYRAKSKRTGVESYVADSDKHSRDYLALVSDLRLAVGTEELFLHYQPKRSIKDGSFAGVEALVRWQHPRLGLLPPDEFVPLAEREGLMRELTLWVLDLALSQQREWRLMGETVPMAVNLSPANLLDTRLPEDLDALIKRHGTAPAELELEITEETLMQDPTRALDVIARISELGVTFSLDDFGTGYSSLAQLRQLPVRSLKIDRSFIANMSNSEEDANIVRSTIQLGHSLKLQVVAEGIETPEHLEELTGFGCDIAQGYHLSRPVPPDQITAWIHTNEATTPAVTRMPGSAHAERR